MLGKEESWEADLQVLINGNDQLSPPCDRMCRFRFIQVHPLLLRKKMHHFKDPVALSLSEKGLSHADSSKDSS